MLCHGIIFLTKRHYVNKNPASELFKLHRTTDVLKSCIKKCRMLLQRQTSRKNMCFGVKCMNEGKKLENVIIAVLVGISVCLFLMSLTVFKSEGFRTDLDYLLFLQSIRDRAGSVINNIFVGITDLGSVYPTLVILSIVYFGIDPELGKNMIRVVGTSFMINGMMKLSVCAFRPWVRDTSIVPLQKATGYSFPSGHTSNAVGVYGTVGIEYKDKKKWLAIAMLILIILIGFSRNYVGAHTPQDVLVGFCSSAVGLLLIKKFEKYEKTGEKRRKVWMFLGMTVVVSIITIIYYELKAYPLPPVVNGETLAYTAELVIDSYEAIGIWVGVAAVAVLHEYKPGCRTGGVPVVVRILRIITGLIILLALRKFLAIPLGLLLPKRYMKVAVNFLLIFVGFGVYSSILEQLAGRRG